MTIAVHTIPQLSIVIPVTVDSSHLEDTLISVLENRPEHSEIIVVLSKPYSDPWNIRDEVRFVQAPSDASHVSCINVGIAASESPLIHVLSAGWRATPGWSDKPITRLASGRVGAIAPVVKSKKEFISTGIRFGAGGRRQLHAVKPMSPHLEVGFWRADILEKVGRGFTVACGDEYADADMAVSLNRMQCPVEVEFSSHVECIKSQKRSNAFLSGLHSERLFWRSLAGGSLLSDLPMHAYEILRHTLCRAPLGSIPAITGRLVGLLQFGSYRQRHEQLKFFMSMKERTDKDTIRFDRPHDLLNPSKQTSTPISRDTSKLLRRSA